MTRNIHTDCLVGLSHRRAEVKKLQCKTTVCCCYCNQGRNVKKAGILSQTTTVLLHITMFNLCLNPTKPPCLHSFNSAFLTVLGEKLCYPSRHFCAILRYSSHHLGAWHQRGALLTNDCSDGGTLSINACMGHMRG